jgi:hypothetical protein
MLQQQVVLEEMLGLKEPIPEAVLAVLAVAVVEIVVPMLAVILVPVVELMAIMEIQQHLAQIGLLAELALVYH